MFSFIKKLLGLPTDEEKKQALESKNEVPYKVEPVEQPVVNNKNGEVVEVPKSTVQTVVAEEVVVKQVEPVKVEEPNLVVVKVEKEEKPVKKARKPAKPKVEKEKGAEKSAPEKVKKSRSKKS